MKPIVTRNGGASRSFQYISGLRAATGFSEASASAVQHASNGQLPTGWRNAGKRDYRSTKCRCKRMGDFLRFLADDGDTAKQGLLNAAPTASEGLLLVRSVFPRLWIEAHDTPFLG